jgi:hypothetical protein
MDGTGTCPGAGVDREGVLRCAVSGCGEPVAALGICWKHYARLRRHGDAGVTRRRYMMPHECRDCGTREPGEFYPAYKSICRACRKVRSIRGGNR